MTKSDFKDVKDEIQSIKCTRSQISSHVVLFIYRLSIYLSSYLFIEVFIF